MIDRDINFSIICARFYISAISLMRGSDCDLKNVYLLPGVYEIRSRW